MAVSKYFIAIVLPSPAMEEVEAIKQDLYHRFNLRGALRSPAHITLHRPFEWKDEKEDRLFSELGKFRFDDTPDISIRNFDFFEPRVIYGAVGHSAALRKLHDELGLFCRNNLGLLNEVNDLRGFHPHVTVAFRDLKRPLFYELRTEFEQKKLSLDFKYEGFSLLKLSDRWRVAKTFKQL